MTTLEIAYYPAKSPKGTIVFWPCWLGDFKEKFYQIPIAELNAMQYSVVLYNPIGHGNSTGLFNLEKSIVDLNDYLSDNMLTSLPLFGISHSGGCNCLLKVAAKSGKFRQLFLFSPILDSRRSLQFMYENNFHQEFIQMLTGNENQPGQHLKIMQDDRWLYQDYWEKMSFSETLNYGLITRRGIKIDSLARVLESTLFPGHLAWEELEKLSDISNIYIPETDHWFPRDELIQKAKQTKTKYIFLPEGTSHFLLNAWENNWQYVFRYLNNVSA